MKNGEFQMRICICFAVCLQVTLSYIANAGKPSVTPNLPELAAVKAYVQASSELGKRQTGPLDQEKVNTQFGGVLQVIKSVDAFYATHHEKDIREAWDKCQEGVDVDINEQIIGKGFQHVTVQAIQRELDFMGDAEPEAAKSSARRITVYFEQIRPTFIRRDRSFFEGQKTLEKEADEALEKLEKSGKQDLLAVSRQLEDSIMRAMALSVLYETSELIKARDNDLRFCAIKQTEAICYYRIIQSRIKKRNPKANELIIKMLNGSFGAINVEELEKYLIRGLSISLRE